MRKLLLLTLAALALPSLSSADIICGCHEGRIDCYVVNSCDQVIEHCVAYKYLGEDDDKPENLCDARYQTTFACTTINSPSYCPNGPGAPGSGSGDGNSGGNTGDGSTSDGSTGDGSTGGSSSSSQAPGQQSGKKEEKSQRRCAPTAAAPAQSAPGQSGAVPVQPGDTPEDARRRAAGLVPGSSGAQELDRLNNPSAFSLEGLGASLLALGSVLSHEWYLGYEGELAGKIPKDMVQPMGFAAVRSWQNPKTKQTVYAGTFTFGVYGSQVSYTIPARATVNTAQATMIIWPDSGVPPQLGPYPIIGCSGVGCPPGCAPPGPGGPGTGSAN